MSRLTDQKEKMGEAVQADPLPDTKVQGDSKDTDEVDGTNDFTAEADGPTPYDD